MYVLFRLKLPYKSKEKKMVADRITAYEMNFSSLKLLDIHCMNSNTFRLCGMEK